MIRKNKDNKKWQGRQIRDTLSWLDFEFSGNIPYSINDLILKVFSNRQSLLEYTDGRHEDYVVLRRKDADIGRFSWWATPQTTFNWDNYIFRLLSPTSWHFWLQSFSFSVYSFTLSLNMFVPFSWCLLIIAIKSWTRMSCAVSVLNISEQETAELNGSSECVNLNAQKLAWKRRRER